MTQKATEQTTAADLLLDPVFSDAAAEWKRHTKQLVKASTMVKYSNILNRYLLPSWGEVPLSQITGGRVRAFADVLLESEGDGRRLSAKTVQDIMSVLKNILKGKIAEPLDIHIRQKSRPIRVFSVQEQKELCRYLVTHPDLRNEGILLCLFTGLRVGELCALKWSDISLSERTLCVRRTMQRLQTLEDGAARTRIEISEPKSDCSLRVIPLPEILLPHIKKRLAHPDAFFLTGECARYVEPRVMQYHFKKVLSACGIDGAGFHSLRHTFATRCVESGFDLKCLSEILGHASVNITLNRYVHPSLQLKQENMSKLSKTFAAVSHS